MRKVIIVAMVILAGLFCGLAIKEELPYIISKQKNKEIRKEYIQPSADSTNSDKETDKEINREVDFRALKQINDDIVGWIYIPGTPIDYPILKNQTDNFYLTHDFTGAWNSLGSIFMQTVGDASFSSKNTILYGHNLVDDQMFGSLTRYCSKKNREEQPYIYVYLPDKTVRYRIYSAYECVDGTRTYQLSFDAPSVFREWVDFTIVAGEEHVTAKIRKVLTLSTCTDSGDARFVVHGSIDLEQMR